MKDSTNKVDESFCCIHFLDQGYTNCIFWNDKTIIG